MHIPPDFDPFDGLCTHNQHHQSYQDFASQHDFVVTRVMAVGQKSRTKSCFEVIFLAIGSHRLNTSSNFFMLHCLVTYVHECFLESYRITISVACSKN